MGDTIKELESEIEALPEDAKPAQRKALQRELEKSQQQYEISQQFTEKLVSEEVQQADPQAVLQQVTNNEPQAADKFITLLMADPERFEAQELDSLLSDTSVQLTDTQRTLVTRYSTAQAEKNRLKGVSGVSQDILFRWRWL